MGRIGIQRRALFLLIVACLLTVGSRNFAFAEPLEKVEPKRVCMVNNTVFPKDQIPVEVGGKTYYGCCEMCKGRLASNAELREALDPVSGKPVDKASATIGAKPDGGVLYFESEKTFQQYAKRS
jgi:YHS domain-containing protein